MASRTFRRILMILNAVSSFLFFFILFLPGLGLCVEYKPWLGDMLVFDWRNSLTYATYPSIAEGNQSKKESGDDIFLNTALSTSYQEYGLELEAMQASTKRQHGSLDHLRATLRYVWLDDVAGDPFTLTSGISYIQAFSWSVKDIGSFHHGKAESELFVAIGKETACGEEWVDRRWAVMALGIADKGSPWIRFNAGYDFKICSHQEGSVFCNSLFGLGGKKLNISHFDGYGPIHHQAVEIGVRYTYLLDCGGSINLEYSNRVYARNFPSRAHIFVIEWLYNFGVDALPFPELFNTK